MLIRILSIKQSIMPLTALERFIYDNKHNDNNSLLTYFYFLAYEDLVLSEKKNGKTYQEIVKALRGENANNATENTHYKTFIFNLSIASVVMLILSASAVSTSTLMGFIDGAGAYTYFVQTFFYVLAAWAQWMIFRKKVPPVLANFFYFSYTKDKGLEWHYLKSRKLIIANGQLIEDKASASPTFTEAQRRILYVLTFFTALLSLSLGMIVLEKGEIFEKMHLSEFFVNTFMGGSFANLMTILCVVYIFTHFALYISSAIELLQKKDGIAKIFNNIKYTGSAVLLGLCLISMFGLINTMTAQAKSTFTFFGMNPFNSNGDVAVGGEIIAMIGLFSVVIALGRVIFNIKAMDNLYWVVRLGAPELRTTLWNDFQQHRANYVVGTLLTVGFALCFGLMGYIATPDQQLFELAGPLVPQALATPLGLTVVATLAAWGLFKGGSRFLKSDEERQQQDGEVQPDKLRPDYLSPTAELRTGQMLGAILVNGATSGAVSVSGMEVMIALYSHALHGTTQDHDFHICLLVLAGIAGAVVSFASAMNAVEVKDSEKEKHRPKSPSI